MSETTIVDPIQAAVQAAMKAAQEAAALKVTADAGAVATTSPATQAVAPMPQRGTPLTMGEMTGGLTVDAWLKVKEFGFILGPNAVLYPGTINVTIDTSACQPAYALKYGQNPARYIKTYDRVTEVGGGSWAAAVQRAQSVDSKAREYRSCDVPMTIVGDVKAPDGTVLLADGSTLGYSTPTTGWGEWEKFWRSVQNANLEGQVVPVTLGYLPRKNASGQTWGLVSFTLRG